MKKFLNLKLAILIVTMTLTSALLFGGGDKCKPGDHITAGMRDFCLTWNKEARPLCYYDTEGRFVTLHRPTTWHCVTDKSLRSDLCYRAGKWTNYCSREKEKIRACTENELKFVFHFPTGNAMITFRIETGEQAEIKDKTVKRVNLIKSCIPIPTGSERFTFLNNPCGERYACIKPIDIPVSDVKGKTIHVYDNKNECSKAKKANEKDTLRYNLFVKTTPKRTFVHRDEVPNAIPC